MSAVAIIGANFGDEGKGLATDYFASKFGGDCVVVRYNGGAQAGHTVTPPNGPRHVFSHFGSGTLAGARTHLSKYFIANPIAYLQEKTLFPNATVTIDPGASVTTPYEMVINQCLELKRKGKRHGSCGMGINETLQREKIISLIMGEICRKGNLTSKLNHIKRSYVPKRLKELELNMDELPKEAQFVLQSDRIRDTFIKDVEEMLSTIEIKEDEKSIIDENIIFEGAQGLLLDRDSRYYPHVTPSKTGICYIVGLCCECGVRRVDVHYVTRSYLTRHGAGELPNEVEGKIYEGIDDPTNVPNKFQGSLRYAPLNLDILCSSILNDFMTANNYSDLSLSLNLLMTCIDQLPEDGMMKYICRGKLEEESYYNVIRKLKKTLDCKFIISRGPTRKDIRNFH